MKSLRTQMTALFVAASVLPLALVGWFERRSVLHLVDQSSADLLSARAEELAWQIDLLHGTYSKSVQGMASVPAITALATAPAEQRAQLAAAAGKWLSSLLASDPYYRKISVLDSAGIAFVSTDSAAVGRSFAFRDYFQEARRGRSAISDVFFSVLDGGAIPLVNYAAPIPGKSGEIVGVIALSVAVNAFWDPMRRLNGRAGKNSFSELYDQHGVRMGHSIDPNVAFHPAGIIDPDTRAKFVADQRFLGRTGELMDQTLPAAGQFEHARGGKLADVFESQSSAGEPQLVASRRLDAVPWTVFMTGPRSASADAARDLPRDLLLTALVVLAVAFSGHALVVRRALKPIRQMTLAAADVARGNYGARLASHGRTELDELARSFNEMAEALSVARAGLEDKVHERTEALESMNLEAERRNRELAERSEELARHRYHEQAKGRALAALTADAELDGVVGAALGEMAAPVRAAVMVCYRLDGSELVPVAAYAASEQARTTAIPLAGMAEQALHKGHIETLDDVPPGLQMRFDCLIAAGTPRFLALVPLRVGNRPTGLLAVGALAPLPPDALTMLSDLAAPLALTMARRALLDHTERIARELARRNEELRTQAEALEAQGEELKAQQRELSLKNREVQKADQLKSEFLANMSHELRTPLNAVIGFSELLLEDRATLSPTQAQWVGDIQESGRHLLVLINRVLDLAKIEAGRTTFRLEPVAPAEAVASACTLVRPTAQKKSIEVSIVESAARPVQADRGHLNQVLLNLIANAVKFSPEKAAVEVGFAEQDGGVRFWVKDQGPGIDAETQARLFEPFFQAESPLVKKHEGTGLGLAISRKLVEGQGGRIGVTSEPGAGSTFFFTLPLATQAPAQPRSAENGRPVFEGEPPLVLVVDDHDLNRELAREMLERRGCRVILARDGEEGVQRARSEHPGLVLVDLAMPRKDGFAVARELRSDPATARTPLVALTALAMRGDDERVLQAGFDGYLPKPLERAALDAALNRFVASRSAQ